MLRPGTILISDQPAVAYNLVREDIAGLLDLNARFGVRLPACLRVCGAPKSPL